MTLGAKPAQTAFLCPRLSRTVISKIPFQPLVLEALHTSQPAVPQAPSAGGSCPHPSGADVSLIGVCGAVYTSQVTWALTGHVAEWLFGAGGRIIWHSGETRVG